MAQAKGNGQYPQLMVFIHSLPSPGIAIAKPTTYPYQTSTWATPCFFVLSREVVEVAQVTHLK